MCLHHAWRLSNTGGGGDGKGLEGIELNDIHRADALSEPMLLVSGKLAGSLTWVVHQCALNREQHWAAEQGDSSRRFHDPLWVFVRDTDFAFKNTVTRT